MSLSIDKSPTTQVEAAPRQGGRYLYCVADSRDRVNLGEIGIDGSQVYTIPHRDLCAVVHDCPAEPYRSDDEAVVKTWVLTHQKVVDAAWERWSTVLPLSFDTIIKDGSGVESWLGQEYDRLKGQIERLRDKAEYGVQVFWDLQIAAQGVAEANAEIGNLHREIGALPRGLAYMHRQRLEALLKRELEAKADAYFKDLCARIRKHVVDLRVEKTKKAEPGWQMILNLSCLLRQDRYMELGEELDKINHMEGLSIRFTGPWPPYSFVGGA